MKFRKLVCATYNVYCTVYGNMLRDKKDNTILLFLRILSHPISNNDRAAGNRNPLLVRSYYSYILYNALLTISILMKKFFILFIHIADTYLNLITIIFCVNILLKSSHGIIG